MPEKGFTIIEVLIVVVIIGILVSIALPAFNVMQDRARESSVKANMHTIQLAVEDYAVLNGGFYASDSGNLTEMFSLGAVNNPFVDGGDFLVSDIPAEPGVVGYDHDTFSGTGYTILGHGRFDLLRNADNSPYSLSPN